MNKLILDGNKVANFIKSELALTIEKLNKQGVNPCLATILVGNDPSSEVYVRMKGNACNKLGLISRKLHLSESTTTEELINTIKNLNQDDGVHGILLQHPVPNHIDERPAFEAIDINKDVDGVTSWGYGQTALGFGKYPSCTPSAIISILDYYKVTIESKHAVVIGRSPILGKPVAAMLLNRNATVTICHSKTENLANIVALADIVVAAVGKPEFVKGEWIKEGAVVIDAGYNYGNVGDVDYKSCLARASAITPVPGGVGPVTIASLLKHTVKSADSLIKSNK